MCWFFCVDNRIIHMLQMLWIDCSVFACTHFTLEAADISSLCFMQDMIINYFWFFYVLFYWHKWLYFPSISIQVKSLLEREFNFENWSHLQLIVGAGRAEQEGIQLKAIELKPFLDFVKRNSLQKEFFCIGPNQCEYSQWLLRANLGNSVNMLLTGPNILS